MEPIGDDETLYLVKIGEIKLKEGNKASFENLLKLDIKRRLSGARTRLSSREGRFYLVVPNRDKARAEFVLSRTPGVNAWAEAIRTRKDIDAITDAASVALKAAIARGAASFKVEARRSDKAFHLDSYAIARELGGRLLEAFPALKVDVKTPDAVVNVEIRERAYMYCDGGAGVRGLPIGSGGKGLLLLSGGIDSPVAGFRMLCRGLALEALHFASWPYTSQEAWEKVQDLASALAAYSGGIQLHSIQFTDVQLAIRKGAPPEKSTLYLRACMMIAADTVARRRGLKAIVTGESLGQVASQTAENMRFSGSYTDFPVLRPLVGTDKEDTIRQARQIGTYETSIRPYEDCCVLFASPHPLLKADFDAERAAFDSLGLAGEVAKAVDAMSTAHASFRYSPPRE